MADRARHMVDGHCQSIGIHNIVFAASAVEGYRYRSVGVEFRISLFFWMEVKRQVNVPVCHGN